MPPNRPAGSSTVASPTPGPAGHGSSQTLPTEPSAKGRCGRGSPTPHSCPLAKLAGARPPSTELLQWVPGTSATGRLHVAAHSIRVTPMSQALAGCQAQDPAVISSLHRLSHAGWAPRSAMDACPTLLLAPGLGHSPAWPRDFTSRTWREGRAVTTGLQSVAGSPLPRDGSLRGSLQASHSWTGGPAAQSSKPSAMPTLNPPC